MRSVLAVEPIASAQCQDRVLAPQLVDPPGICVSRKLTSQQALPETSDLILVEIPDEVAHQFGSRPFVGLHSMHPQSPKDVRPVTDGALCTHAVAPSTHNMTP